MVQNPFFSGAGYGLLAPMIAHALTNYTSLPISTSTKPLALYVIAALINLILVRYFYRKGHEAAARGVILTTFALAMIFIFTTKLSLT